MKTIITWAWAETMLVKVVDKYNPDSSPELLKIC